MARHSPSRPVDNDRVEVRALLRGIFRRYRLIAGLMIGFGVLFYVVAMQLPANYTATAKVILDPRNVQVTQSDALVSAVDMSEPVIFSEISVMRSNVLLGDLIAKLGLERLEAAFEIETTEAETHEARVAALVAAIREDLTIQREGQSYVVDIYFDGHDPQLTADIVNGIADTYIAVQLTNRREGVRQATAWIEELVNQARDKVDQAETALARARAQSLDQEGSSYDNANQQLGNLTSELAVARSNLAAAQAEYDRLSSIFDTQGAQALADAVTSPLLESLMADRVELQRKDEEWARSYDASHPQRVRLAAQIAQLDEQLAAEAKRVIDQRANDVAVAQLREASLAKSVKSLEDQLAGISENTVTLRQREREADAARQNYESLLARLSSATGQEKLQLPEARVIERAALPEAPTSPKPKLLAAFGGLLGLTAAVVAALVSEMTRSTFRSRNDIVAETGLRVLTVLPQVPGKDMRAIVTGLRSNSNTFFGERIRQLRTFLFMRNGRFEKRVIMITSSRPGEGKSLTAVALAEMAVLAGKSVIVVDGDLRRSTLAKSFGWQPKFDMADLALDYCALDDAIHSDPALGFDVLVTAHHSIEAADELNADWLGPMIEELKHRYDVVVIDSPPVLDVADGLVLARIADSIVYVVRWDSTTRQAVGDGLEALSVMRSSVAGIVLTQADPKHAESGYGDSYAQYTE